MVIPALLACCCPSSTHAYQLTPDEKARGRVATKFQKLLHSQIDTYINYYHQEWRARGYSNEKVREILYGHIQNFLSADIESFEWRRSIATQYIRRKYP